MAVSGRVPAARVRAVVAAGGQQGAGGQPDGGEHRRHREAS
jgi:hypothetical protein